MKSDWLVEHDVRKDVFENLFRIKERLYGKKILLYGLNSDTKSAIMFLAECHISVEGFLIAQDENELVGTKYLGKPVFIRRQFLKMDTVGYTVLDVYGDFFQEIWDIFQVRSDTLDLCYRDFSDFLVWVLLEDEKDARAFMWKFGLPESIFVCGTSGAGYLSRRYVLDTHLGYANPEGSPVHGN